MHTNKTLASVKVFFYDSATDNRNKGSKMGIEDLSFGRPTLIVWVKG